MTALTTELLTYPLPGTAWPELIAFWQTEWPRTDVDWLAALSGALAESLTVQLALARAGGEIVGTASVYYSRAAPEVCCIADVLTSPSQRGRGIAARLTDLAVTAAFAAGCRAAYLGNKPTAHCVYEKVGFQRVRGAVMRRAAPGAEQAEAGWYAEGQPMGVRETVWGDLPSFAAFLAQPLACVFADYPRGLMSLRSADPVRCVSAFTTVWNEVAARGGKMLTLVGGSPHRVLGFGTLTPEAGTARSHRAVLEVAAHDHYEAGAALLTASLLREARARSLAGVLAYAAESDRTKLRLFRHAGLRSIAKFHDHARWNGGAHDVACLELLLA
jgi:GNAT superfamily N-acetyltransferase/L-amino acid N-acyltransferase YncA